MIPSVAATRPVRFGLRAALIADTAVTALVGQRIYNGERPQGAPLPAIVTQNPTQADWGTAGQPGATGLWMLHSWADTADTAEQIIGACAVALGGVVLTLDGFAHVSGEVDVLDVMRDPDAPIYHGVAAYRWTALGNKGG